VSFPDAVAAALSALATASMSRPDAASWAIAALQRQHTPSESRLAPVLAASLWGASLQGVRSVAFDSLLQMCSGHCLVVRPASTVSRHHAAPGNLARLAQTWAAAPVPPRAAAVSDALARQLWTALLLRHVEHPASVDEGVAHIAPGAPSVRVLPAATPDIALLAFLAGNGHVVPLAPGSLRRCYEAAAAGVVAPSGAQKALAHALRANNAWSILEEESIPAIGFRADVILQRDQRVVVVEADGPTHFRADGTPTLATTARRRIVAALGIPAIAVQRPPVRADAQAMHSVTSQLWHHIESSI